MTRAATFWNSSLLEGLVSVAVVRVSGVLAALVLAREAGFAAAIAVGLAWLGSGWWSWRVSARALDAQFDKAPELREVEYLTEVALSPGPGKDVRIFRLGPWFVDRQRRQWERAMEPLWSSRRRALPGGVVSAAAVVATHVMAVAVLLGGRHDAGAIAAGLSALLATSGLGEIPFGHYELEFGLRTVPENRAVVEGVRSRRFALPGGEKAPAVFGHIGFEGVSFAYPSGGSQILNHLDLVLESGTSTALVGVNGAGKSTLVKLLCRFYDPTAGTITVDGTDLCDIEPASWQNGVAALFQDFVRYPLPARDNIGLGATAGDARLDDEVLAAARLAGIGDVLEALPNGLDTPLTRGFGGGTELSGGQWQRIGLARAVFAVSHGARLLVLDEPTSHLDARAESELYDRFLEVTQGVTTLLVSHRFSTVRRADRIAVLDGGRITEYGSHDELVAFGGTYARLFTLQAAMFGDDADV
jgi:ATP-binding cassette subfamily B protein